MNKVTTYGKSGVRALLAAMLVVFALVVASAMPAQKAYAADTGSITLTYTASDTEQPISYMAVYLYKVASIEGGSYILDGSFTGYADILGWNGQSYPVSSDATWLQETAETLDAYVRASAPDPTAFGTTDATGTVVFSGLENGLYLVLEVGDGVHKISPSLINVGGAEGKDIVAKPKNETPNNPVTEVKVVKHWKGDSEDTSSRPESIKVQLMCDSEKYGDVVELNDANAWTYSWTGLDDSTTHKWDVLEVDAPSGYSVNIAESSGTFTITNTINENPPNNPPSNPPTTNPPTTTNTPSKTITGKLPQTGQLWWPVPVLLCAGIVAIGAGRIVSSRSRAK